jgi:putative DNA primase/helicase
MNAIEAASGRWPDLLAHFCGLTPEQLSDKHQPCPLCGGKDRYRFDDKDGTGSWYCNKCGGKDQTGGGGTGMDLFMRHQRLTYIEACQRIEQHLGIAKPIPEPPIAHGKSAWRYSDTFYVVRKDKPDGGKDILPLIWDGSAWKWKAPPAPRPLYGKRQLALKPDAPVLVVEGEKTADAAALLYPSAVVITWPSGCKAIDKADWSPLAGRRCVLWPDADAVGREAMAKLAIRLLKVGATQVRIVHPPADVPEGWDLADADWSVAAAAAYLKHNRSAPIQLPELAPEPEPEPVIEPEPLPDGNDYFTCLGFDHDAFYYQPHSTGQVTRLSRSAHTGTNLCAIAPLAYWESLYPSKTGANWTAAASSLFERQAAAGIYAPDRIRGRGAWWDQKQSVLHLGDRLVLSDREVSVSAGITGSRYLYQRLGCLRGPGKAVPLGDQDAYVLLELAGRFKWEVPASGLLIAGWAALAPICGALDWRPHIWLTAGAGSGKSAILDRYIGPLLGDLALHVAGNTSEAGLRQTLRADALPVVFDEAESNERPDQQRMQSVLSLARVASSESRAQTIKGSAEGDAQRYTIRSMFLMSSIATALKQGADKSRFAQLTLRNPNEFAKDVRLAHWEALDRDLDRYVTEQIGQRLQARTISLIPVIRQSVKVFTRAAAEAFDSQRLGDQYGTLLAGAWSLQSSEVATRDQAFALIDQNDWESYSQTTEVPDEKRCLQRILQHQIRVEADKVITRTIGELVERSLGYSNDLAVTKELAEATLGRNGIKADNGCVVISNTAEAIAAILSDTPWSNCWSTVLARLPGATKPGVTRFKGVTGASRAVSIPISEA